MIEAARSSPGREALVRGVKGRIAVFGVDGRRARRLAGENMVFCRSSRFGGNGELRRFENEIRSGSIGEVIILARWNGHACTDRVRGLCHLLGVPCRVG